MENPRQSGGTQDKISDKTVGERGVCYQFYRKKVIAVKLNPGGLYIVVMWNFFASCMFASRGGGVLLVRKKTYAGVRPRLKKTPPQV